MLCLHLPKFIIRSTAAAPALQIKYLSTKPSNPGRQFRKATHCIFDLDGLLLDTESLYKRAFSEVVQDYGKVYTHEIQMKHMGTPCEIGCKIIIDELGIKTTIQEFEDRFHKVSQNLIEDCKLMPGAEKVIHNLKSHGIPIAIATSSQEPGYSIKTKNHKKFLKLFEHIVVSVSDPEVKRGKPHPDIYLVCASRFKNPPKPEQCLAFEDSPNGVKAAMSANMQCVMIPHPEVPLELCKEATIVSKSLELVPFEQFGLPALRQ